MRGSDTVRCFAGSRLMRGLKSGGGRANACLQRHAAATAEQLSLLPPSSSLSFALRYTTDGLPA